MVDRRNLLRGMAAGLIGTPAALNLASCSSGASGGGSKSITVMMEVIPYTDNIKSMLSSFQEKTGITVNIQTVPYSDEAAKVLQGFAQKSDYYAAVFIDNVYGSGYFESKYIVDLKPLAEKYTQFGGFDDFYQPYLKALTTKSGAVYGLPVYGESTFLMYRKDLFDKYGIKVPTTMDALMAAAKTVKEKSGGQVAGMTLRGAAGIQNVYPWAGFLRSFGGDWYDADGTIAIDSPESIKATEFWAKLLRDYGPAGAANFNWEQNRIAFTNGDAAMTIDATANGPFNEDPKTSKVVGKVGYAPIPYARGVTPGDNTNHSLEVHALYVTAFGKSQDSAYQFISWATSKPVQQHAVETVEAVGATNKDVLTSSAFAKKYGAFKDAMMSQLKTGNVDYLPSGQNANTIILQTGQALSKVLAGQQSAEAALKTAAQSITAQIQ